MDAGKITGIISIVMGVIGIAILMMGISRTGSYQFHPIAFDLIKLTAPGGIICGLIAYKKGRKKLGLIGISLCAAPLGLVLFTVLGLFLLVFLNTGISLIGL